MQIKKDVPNSLCIAGVANVLRCTIRLNITTFGIKCCYSQRQMMSVFGDQQ